MKLEQNKVKCEITVDLDTGEYETRFINVSNPGESMDFTRIMLMLRRIVENVTDRGEDPETSQVTRLEH